MIYILVFSIIYLIIVYLWYEWVSKKEAEEMVDEFIREFPGKCMICSYHRFGINSCIISPNTKVDKHYCIEKGEIVG